MTQTIQDFNNDPNWERLRALTLNEIARRRNAGGNVQGPPVTPDIEFLTPDVRLLDEHLADFYGQLESADAERVPTFAKAFGVIA